MRIVSYARIRDFVLLHNNSEIPLNEWYKKTEQGEWLCFADIKKTFNSVDSVGNNRFVFNIKGNSYRLVAIVIFASQKVYIRYIGTHKDYEKIDCSYI